MKLFSFIKKITIGILLLQSQTQGASPREKILLEDGAAHPAPQDAFFNPCEDLGFHLAAGKATRNTTRWMIGETHTYRESSTACIKRLLKLSGKTSIYVEGIDFRRTDMKCEYYFDGIISNSKVACLGWDDMDLQYEAYESDPELAFLARMFSLQNIYYELKNSDREFTNYLEMLKLTDVNDVALKERYPEKHIAKEVAYLRNTADRLLKERKKAKSFDALFKAYDELDRHPRKAQTNMEYKRNKALINALRTHPKDHRAIVLAGRSHFSPMEGDPKARDYVSKALESDKVSYATLQFRPK